MPSIIASVFEPLASIVDTGLVGHLSTHSLAALGLAVAVFNSITWMFNFLVHASTQTIADFKTKNNDALLRERIKIALSMALIVGVSCTVVLYLPRDFWFSLVGGKAELRQDFYSYFNPRALCHLFTVLSITALGILRGFGELKLVLRLMILSTSLNILVSYIFLYPMQIGLAGAAWGTVVSHFITSVFGLYYIVTNRRVGFDFWKFKAAKQQWLQFGKSSFDLFGRSFTLTLCFFATTRLASRLGVAELGAHQALLQVWLLASFFLDGLAISGNILGARFYFAGHIQRTAIVFRELLKLGVVVGLVFTILYLGAWDFVCRLFSDDPRVLTAMDNVEVIIIASQAISAIAFVFDGLIFGLGGFSFLRKHIMIGALLVFAPLALTSLWLPDLKWIWSALVALNLYRGLSGYYFVHKKVFTKVQ